MIVSKGESLLVPKVVNLKFRRFSGIVLANVVGEPSRILPVES